MPENVEEPGRGVGCHHWAGSKVGSGRRDGAAELGEETIRASASSSGSSERSVKGRVRMGGSTTEEREAGRPPG